MPSKNFLFFLFGLILVTMLVVTSTANFHESLFKIPVVVQQDVWFQATLWDAYFGFTTFYVWVWYRSPHWASRLIWFVLIMALGNMAMASYMLWRLYKWQAPYEPKTLLLRPESL